MQMHFILLGFIRMFNLFEGLIIQKSHQETERSPKIIGGVVSSKADWPWQVAIFTYQNDVMKPVFLCGGTLIQTDVILTAAHCLASPSVKPDQLLVVAGEYDRTIEEGTEQTRSVINITLHPIYVGNSPLLDGNDIAIVQLNESVLVTEHVKPIPRVTNDVAQVKASQRCFMTGWGVSDVASVGKSKQPLPTKLVVAEMTIISNRECNRRDQWDGIIVPTQLCATNKRTSACLGDSGGPLSCWIQGQYHLVGVISWGPKTCRGKPSVCTRVSAFKTWIEDTLATLHSPNGSQKQGHF
ncbi:hypothetical protein CHS0354_035476 [Potamilus streckersoni]|uniref:Peptidase S1 domain-containing protein n=1 Tax=Potamilus streckersoni TaxID=2493646 RepID=A0AAE0RVL1_9BIVA|nr:hypothetical protein CHS0354_035476 [Potamilus streckersoni]